MAAATRDPWALVGFAVPAGIALVFGLWGILDSRDGSGGGYQGLIYIFWIVAWGPGVLLWMLAGWIAARAWSAPEGSARQFAKGAAVGLGVSWIVLAATCFGSYS